MNRFKEIDSKTAPHDDEPLVSGANTHCVAIPDAWPARAVHRRMELEVTLIMRQEKVPGSLMTGVGLIVGTMVPLSIPPSQHGDEFPHGSQPRGAAPQGSQGELQGVLQPF